MSDAFQDLALRKELLVAQSTLERAKLRYQVIALRSRAPMRMRIPLFGLLLLVAGRLRAGRLIAGAARILMLMRLVRGAVGMLGRK
jgi:hypothetical protein